MVRKYERNGAKSMPPSADRIAQMLGAGGADETMLYATSIATDRAAQLCWDILVVEFRADDFARCPGLSEALAEASRLKARADVMQEFSEGLPLLVPVKSSGTTKPNPALRRVDDAIRQAAAAMKACRTLLKSAPKRKAPPPGAVAPVRTARQITLGQRGVFAAASAAVPGAVRNRPAFLGGVVQLYEPIPGATDENGHYSGQTAADSLRWLIPVAGSAGLVN